MSNHNLEAEHAAFEAWFTENKFGGMKESMWAAWEACARRAPAVGEDGLPPPVAPKGPFADYSAEEVETYAGQYARDAVAADRRARGDNDAIQSVIACSRRVLAKFGADSDWSEWRDLGDALKELGAQQPASAAQAVKTWQECMPEHVKQIGSAASQVAYMEREIADLRAQLASERQAKEYEQRHATESEKALAAAQAQLARQSQEGA